MSWSLAIDFGTCNTTAAIGRGGEAPRPIRLTPDADQMPSCVLLDVDGTVLVGTAARHHALLAPDRFEPTPKRRLREERISLGDQVVAPARLVAAVLRSVVTRARAVAGGSAPDRVVLTHPAAWASQRLEVLRAAATEADIGEAEFVPEPIAAAAHYARAGRTPTDGRSLAVFDFGGGTCDVALLTATGRAAAPFRIDGAHGHDLLGGELLDLRLVDWSLDELRAGGHTELADRLETPDGLRWSLALREQARAAKHALSEVAWAPIVVEAGDQQVVLTVTSEEFDRLVLPDIDASVGLVEELLGEADLDTASIGAVYLSGGSSYVRAAHRQLTSFLGFAPAPLDDPKLVTALGALDVRAALASEASGQVADAGIVVSTVCGNFPPVQDAWGDLAEGLATYLRGGGRTALDHVSRIRGRLADLHPDRSLEVNLLLTALRDGAVAEMRSAPDAAAAIQQLSDRLVRDHALTPHNARAALATWASALARSDDGS